MKRRSKYHNVKTDLDGVTFDSKGEAARWAILKTMARGGQITHLQRQVPYELHTLRGDAVGKIVVDFSYMTPGVGIVLEDFKSKATMTALFRWKRKHLESEYMIPLRVVTNPRADVK